MIAVIQDARSLAVIGVSGWFLAPILRSTGGGATSPLFGYYAVLNAGILAIAWFKAWRALNLVRFAFTSASARWGRQLLPPRALRHHRAFLVLFFALYVAIPILFARRQPRASTGTSTRPCVGVPSSRSGCRWGS